MDKIGASETTLLAAVVVLLSLCLLSFWMTGCSHIGKRAVPPQQPVLNEFNDLTDWRVRELSAWRVTDLNRDYLAQYKGGNIVELSKVFNAQVLRGRNIDRQLKKIAEDESTLIAAVRARLVQNGWQLVQGPPDCGPYQEFIYSKSGKPLILKTGARNAVIGGMYVSLQFQY